MSLYLAWARPGVRVYRWRPAWLEAFVRARTTAVFHLSVAAFLAHGSAWTRREWFGE